MKRRTLIAGVAVVGASAAAGLYRFTDVFVKHYPPTPYDDLLVQLVDRHEAARLGAHAADMPGAETIAARLRPSLNGGKIAAVAEADVAAGRLLQVDGWVLPQSLALLSALAARSQPSP